MIKYFEEVNTIAMDIAGKFRKILELFPKENEHILKHLAASSIHMAMFMRDLHDISIGDKSPRNEQIENKFLNDCGCKDKND